MLTHQAAVILAASLCLLSPSVVCSADPIEPRLVHLRSGATREWDSFPEKAEGVRWERRFMRPKNEGTLTLRLRQQDVKQVWRVLLNEQLLGELILDERDLWRHFPIKPGLLAGENLLQIVPKGPHASPDDIRVGQIELIDRAPQEWLGQCRVEVEIAAAENNRLLPGCVTIVDRDGALMPVDAVSNDHLAVRTGIVYTSTGRAAFGLPPGDYTLYAGRGFEYSRAEHALHLDAAQPIPPTKPIRLTIRHEVPVPGYVACDTHIHTLTHSGHGDATLAERMITLAGEGIELPIATDHNVHVDYEAEAKRLNVRQYFTPVMGDEYTTKVGHFNLFPVAAGARVPDAKLTDWKAIFAEAYATPGVRVCILNHARDLHSGTRPFAPALFNRAVAEQLEGWPLKFNAMEVINSGATQTDPLELTRDWMALLNRGYQVTPVGSSDSHDVARFVVGQGRTYLRTDDRDPSKIDVKNAVDAFLAGRVLVSYGLLAEILVKDAKQVADLTTIEGSDLVVVVKVSSPHWVRATGVDLYLNGRRSRGNLGTATTWKLPKPKHDVFLVAVATGDGIAGPYWQTAKPYQPTSQSDKTKTLGISGAIWIDGDGDGRRSSARDYAERLWAGEKDLAKLLPKVADYDGAVAMHVAHLYHTAGGDLDGPIYRAAVNHTTADVAEGFRDYLQAWRESAVARRP